MEPKPPKLEPLSLPHSQLNFHPDSEAEESWSSLSPVTSAGLREHNPVCTYYADVQSSMVPDLL